MDDTITTIYCLCDDFLKAVGHRDDLQVTMSTAEVMTVPLVASTCFGANIDKTRLFLHEYGYIKKILGKSRLNRRVHAIEAGLWQGLFALLAEFFKQRDAEGAYVVDSLPVAVCDNIRIRRCRLYPLKEHGEERSAATSQASGATSTACACIWWSRGPESRWSSPWLR